MRLLQWLKKTLEAGAGVDAGAFTGGRALQKESLEGKRERKRKKKKKRKRKKKGDGDDDEDGKGNKNDDEEPLDTFVKALQKRGARRAQSSALVAWSKRRGHT